MAEKLLIKDSILTQSTSSFLEEYHSNALFVESLRKQSNKIEEMMAYIQRLKSEGQIKDRLINQLKKKQSDNKMQRIKIEECITEEYLGKLRIAELRIEQLESTINQLQIQNGLLNVIKMDGGSDLRNFKHVQYQQIDRLNLDYDHVKKENKKLIERYNNCRQQCVILRQQLEEQRKNNKQLQFLLRKSTSSKQLLSQQAQIRYKKLQNDLMNIKKQKAALQANNMKLEQCLRQMQNQLSLRIGQYESQIRDMMDQIAKFEANSINWKEKYYELQIMVNQIQSLRNSHRINKIYTKNEKNLLNQDYTRILCKKTMNIPAQNDIITEESQSETQETSQYKNTNRIQI